MDMNKSTAILGIRYAILIVAVGVLYGQFLWNPIVFDDTAFFLLDDLGNQPVSLYHFSLFELRSLPYATLAWTKEWFGLDLINFRVGNLLMHAAVVLSLFSFLSALFTVTIAGKKPQSLSPEMAAFFAALLFALHPVAVYAVGYLVQRTIVMATLFSVLAMLAYVRGSSQKSQGWLWATVPLYYLAVFSKEHAIMLGAVLLALTVLLHENWQQKLKQRWTLFATLFAIALFVLIIRRGFLGTVYEINAPEMLRQYAEAETSIYPQSVLTQSWLFFKYAFLWVLPNPVWMSVDMREPFASSVFSPYLLSAIGFLAWGGAALRLLMKRGASGLLGFAMLFPWLMFFTEFSSVRIQESFVLYRSYLWAAGAVSLLPILFLNMERKAASVLLASIAIAMLPISMERLLTFSHPILLWQDAEKLVSNRTDLPGVSRIYYNLGTAQTNDDFVDAAIPNFKRAIALDGDFPHSHGNLGAAYFKKEDWGNAVSSFGAAIEMVQRTGAPVIPRYIYGRAQAYEKLGETQKALADYAESCRLVKRGCEKLSFQSSGKKN